MLRPGIARAFRLLLGRRDRVELDVREEIEHHLALATELLMQQGHSAGEARAEAVRRLGGDDSLDDVHRRLADAALRREERMRFRERIDTVRDDLRFARRQLYRSPAFSFAVIATLALGIGANATMFGLVDRLLLRPPGHVSEPERIVQLTAAYTRRGVPGRQGTMSWPVYRAMREALAGADVEQVAATSFGTVDLPIGRGERARSARGVLVTASFFPLMGVRPALGRFFMDSEDVEPVGAPVVVIGHGMWTRDFGGEPSVLGRELEIGRRTYTIVGVAPRGFTGNELGSVDVWIPITAAEGLQFAGARWATERQSTWLTIFVRMARGAAIEPMLERATAVNREHGEPRFATLEVVMEAVPLVSSMRNLHQGLTASVAALLGAVSLLVLLIACANVANLLLARAMQRRREIAVRLALGISRARLIRQLLTESVVLALIGGAVALAIVRWGGELVRTLLFGDLRWEESVVDGRVLLFTASAAMLTGLLAGLIPALQSSRPSLTGALKAGAGAGGDRRHRTRAALLVTQAALAVVLLVGTGAFVHSLRNLHALPLGMDVDRVLLGTMDLRAVNVPPTEVDAIFRRMEEGVRALPGVRSAAVAATIAGRGTFMDDVSVPGRDSIPTPAGGGPYLNAVRPGFFTTVGSPLLRGRDFSDGDERSRAPVAIVNETLARLAWPGDDPIGKCVRIGADTMPCLEIVGVVADSRRQNWIEEEISQIWIPLSRAERWIGSRVLVVRPVGGRPDAAAAEVRRAMQMSAPNLPHAQVRVLEDLFARELRPWRLGAAMFGAFAVLAVVLAAVGLYGMISLDVTQRTRELGLRMALGATAPDVVRLVMRRTMLVVAIGCVIGVTSAVLASPRIEALLFRASARDPAIHLAVIGVLMLVAIVASLLPSWRATRVDPALALRAE